MGSPRPEWPEGRRFAFTVFDDPDEQRTEDGREVYALLADLGFRTTRGVWPLPPVREPAGANSHCGEPAHVKWLRDLQDRGFELGWHNATLHTSSRPETILGLERFRELFGGYPSTMANHYVNAECIYWGSARLTGWRRLLYDAATLGRNRNRFRGHVAGDPLFWGDRCREHLLYARNFVFRETNTLAVCPYMPYHDPLRPFVRFWYASSEGGERDSFVERISESNQDKLEEEGGACIMYAHFGKGFVSGGRLDRMFRDLMERLSRRPGWYVPVAKLLDYLRGKQGGKVITPAQRSRLEGRWLAGKLRHGPS